MNRFESGALAFHIKTHSVNNAIGVLDRIGNGLRVTHIALNLFEPIICILKQVLSRVSHRYTYPVTLS
jgi:hypothetical protein